MKLFLTSAGFLNKKLSQIFLQEVAKEADKIKILMVVGVRNPEEEFYVKESEKELNDLGIKNIEIFKLNHTINDNDLENFDAVYICGGNTYFILQKIRETNLDRAIKNFMNRGGIYIGVSAGSIIAGPNIDIAGWGTEGDKNDMNLQDLSGLELVSFAIFPHFKPELKEELEKFQKKVSYEVIPLADNQALFIKNNNQIIIK